MTKTKIQWCDHSWSPVTGCTPIGWTCKNCYAARFAKRLAGRYGYPKDNPFSIVLRPERLTEPLKVKKPSTFFVCSMGDLFHKDVPFPFIQKAIGITYHAPNHRFIILTKRPYRLAEYLQHYLPIPLNCWIGISICRQTDVTTGDIDALLRSGTTQPILSIEPLLAPISSDYLHRFPKIRWIIVGCETGPGRRHCSLDWIKTIVTHCRDTHTPCFVKQIELNGKVNKNPAEWPPELRVRQFPWDKPEKIGRNDDQV